MSMAKRRLHIVWVLGLLLCACCFSPVAAYREASVSGGADPQRDTLLARIAEAQHLLDDELFNSAVTMLNEVLSAYDYVFYEADSNREILSQIYYRLGFAYFYLTDYEKSLASFYDILKIEGLAPYFRAKAYIGIANVANARHDVAEAEKALDEVLEINETLQDNTVFISVYNNLANMYTAKGIYDTALFYLEKAYEKSFDVADHTRPMAIMMNMANVLQILNRPDQAEYYYLKTIKEAEKQENQYALCEAQYGLALLFLKNRRDAEGMRLLNTCLQTASDLDYKRIKLLIYGRLGRYYEEKDDYAKAYHYLALRQELNDSVFNLESERSINRLKADFDLYQIETTKQLLERDVAIYKGKIFRRNVNIAVLLLLVLAAGGIALYIMRKLRNRNQAYSSLRSDFDHFQANVHDEKRRIRERFETELETKHKELTTNALLLVKSEEIAGEILEQVRRLKIGAKGEQAEILASVEASAKELYMGKGWEEFKYSFEQVNTTFYEHLDARYPGLTASDRRFAALICLGLTTKEIAVMTNRSVRGVETSKFRLKKKMGLESDQSLTEVLMALK